jgi:hypothetical protein
VGRLPEGAWGSARLDRHRDASARTNRGGRSRLAHIAPNLGPVSRKARAQVRRLGERGLKIPRPTARQHLPASSTYFSAGTIGAIGSALSWVFGMGRPSLIALTLEVEGGALRNTTIVGAAVIVSSGSLEL